MLPNPPFSVVCAGLCPQLLGAGEFAPGSNCTIQSQGVGLWQVIPDDDSIIPGNAVLLPSGGSGSNITEGISFGQSAQVGRAFSFAVYRNDTGALVDIPVSFVIFKIAN